jgi:hypothetical protein
VTLLVLYPGALVPPESLNSVPLEYYSCTSRSKSQIGMMHGMVELYPHPEKTKKKNKKKNKPIKKSKNDFD